MAKASWLRLTRTKDVMAPLGGRPVAVGATFAVAPHGRHVAVLDALPPAGEAARDDEDAARIRVFAHDGRAFTRVLEETPKRVGHRCGDLRVERLAVSDTGSLAYCVGASVRVITADGSRREIEATGAWPFFDPIAPERLRLVVRRGDGEVIETHDTKTGAVIDTLRIGESGNVPPAVDPATGDVLLFDGWYARDGGAHVPIARGNGTGPLLRIGDGTLLLGHEVERANATQRFARDGASLPVPDTFVAWRRADAWRARGAMLASVDGARLVSPWNGKPTLFETERLAPIELPELAPKHVTLGTQVLALVDEHLAIGSRFGLHLFDPRTGVTLGDGPLALLGLGLAGDRIVTLHEDGLRVDGGAAIALGAEPRLDGLTISAGGRWAAVCCGSEDFPVLVIEVATGREVCRALRAGSVAWLDEERLVVHGALGLRIIEVGSGAVITVGELPGPARLASDGSRRFFVCTATELIEHDPDGRPQRTRTISKKLKGYTWPSELVVRGDEVYALARKRVFRWDAAGECERLTQLENAVGGPKLDPQSHDGPFRSIAVSAEGQLAMTTKTKSHALGIVVFDRAGTVASWTGPTFGRRTEHGERGWAAFRGASLVTATEHGDVGVYAL